MLPEYPPGQRATSGFDLRLVYASVEDEDWSRAERVVRPLLKTLDYDTSGDAVRWWPRGRETPIVLDPNRAFGAAIVERSCVPTRALFDAHIAGETPESIAKWFRVDLDEVKAAIGFEKSLRRPTARA